MASAVEQKALTTPSQIDPDRSSLKTPEGGNKGSYQSKGLRFGFLKVSLLFCQRSGLVAVGWNYLSM